MGVPKFYRWISERYPLINQPIPKQDKLDIPLFDNLYLDCNGIIHNSIYTEDGKPLSYDEMISRVMSYVDKLVSIITPQKLLFIALDGVAPRAKMNQQRARRFRSSKERLEKQAAENNGAPLHDDLIFDSNCITPGTEFMTELSNHFYYFIKQKVNNEWCHFQVIFSGTETPGEGEHKILNYIRHQKSLEGYNANTTHCLYGLDADLIMLGLLTHEPHFSILREEVVFGRKQQKKDLQHNFQLLHLSILREYLELEFASISFNFPLFNYDPERIIDDFIFMCFFVGNDFLPNLPYCAIHENTLSHLFSIYKMNIGIIGDYLIDKGRMNLLECEIFFKIFSTFERNELSKFQFAQLEEEYPTDYRDKNDENDIDVIRRIRRLSKRLRRHQDKDKHQGKDIQSSKRDLLPVINDYMLDKSDDNNNDDNDNDWKDNYYRSTNKFNEEELQEKRKICISSYIEGLNWVLGYYYLGVPSWKWYFPYHYAPLISDLTDLHSYKTEFPEVTEPFDPLLQLMSVLPLASAPLLPPPIRRLMVEGSPIAHFYPKDFEIEIPNNKMPWEGIVLIPFIDETLLLDAYHSVDFNEMSVKERARNQMKPTYLFKYELGVDESVAPSLESAPALHHIHVKHEEYEICKPDRFAFVLMKEARVGMRMNAHFPTFRYLKHIGAKEMSCGVNVFGTKSRHSSLVVRIYNRSEDLANQLLDDQEEERRRIEKEEDEDENGPQDEFISLSDSSDRVKLLSSSEIDMKAIEEAVNSSKKSISMVTKAKEKELEMEVSQIGRLFFGAGGNPSTYVCFPYLNEAVVDEVICTTSSLSKHGVKDHSDEERKTRASEIQKAYMEYYIKKAVEADIHILLNVRKVISMKENYDGSRVKIYGDPFLYPYILSIKDVVNKDVRLMERSRQSAIDLLPLHTPVIITKPKEMMGSFGVVSDHVLDLVKVSFNPPPSLIIPFDNEFYHKDYHVASQLKIKKDVLNRISGSLTIDQKINNAYFDIGLQLKFQKRGQKALGYTRKSRSGEWEYSDKAIRLLRDYLTEFPQIFDYLHSSQEYNQISLSHIFPNGDDYSDDDSDNNTNNNTNDNNNGDQTINKGEVVKKKKRTMGQIFQRIISFFNEQKVHSIQRISIGCESLITFQQLHQIEDLLQAYYDKKNKKEGEKIEYEVRDFSLPLEALLYPVDDIYSFEKSTREIGDMIEVGERVVYVRNQLAPFGSFATVVFVDYDNYLISLLFDLEFLGGTNFNIPFAPLSSFILILCYFIIIIIIIILLLSLLYYYIISIEDFILLLIIFIFKNCDIKRILTKRIKRDIDEGVGECAILTYTSNKPGEE